MTCMQSVVLLEVYLTPLPPTATVLNFQDLEGAISSPRPKTEPFKSRQEYDQGILAFSEHFPMEFPQNSFEEVFK